MKKAHFSAHLQPLKTGNAAVVFYYRGGNSLIGHKIVLHFSAMAACWLPLEMRFSDDCPNANLHNARFQTLKTQMIDAVNAGFDEAEVREIMGAKPAIPRTARIMAPNEKEIALQQTGAELFTPPAAPVAEPGISEYCEDAPLNHGLRLAAITDSEAGWIVIDPAALRITGARNEAHALSVLDAMTLRGVAGMVYERKYASKIVVERIKF